MLRRLAPALLLLMLCFTAAMPTASAWNPFGRVDCTDAAQKDSAVCTGKTSEDPISGTQGILASATNVIAYIAGAAAIIIIIISGIRYMTAAGDSSKIQSARSTLINALIGLAVIVLAKAIITFVIGRL